MSTEQIDEKLSAIVQQINTETIARNHADATTTQRLNALEKLVAEQGADLTANLNCILTQIAEEQIDVQRAIASLKADVQALKQANDIAALAADVSNMRSVLEQLLVALSDEVADDEHEGHTIEQVKAAYLAIVRNDADEVTLAHIEAADVLGDHGDEYRLINSTHDRSWTISKATVAELLAGEDDQ